MLFFTGDSLSLDDQSDKAFEEVMNDVLVVDDDPSVRTALDLVLSESGFAVTSFVEGETFLSAARARVPDCLLIDIHLPGCSGLDLLRKLDAHHYPAPIFMISGLGDNPTAVDAIRNGALDLIEKPFDATTLVTRIRGAIAAWANRDRDGGVLLGNYPGHERLTARERDVLACIARGASNKEAGRELGISPRTVEVHRARIMEKLAAKNAADLMRIVLRGERRHNGFAAIA